MPKSPKSARYKHNARIVEKSLVVKNNATRARNLLSNLQIELGGTDGNTATIAKKAINRINNALDDPDREQWAVEELRKWISIAVPRDCRLPEQPGSTNNDKPPNQLFQFFLTERDRLAGKLNPNNEISQPAQSPKQPDDNGE